MRSYNQYCPIARGSEIFATRWTPIIIRNMLVGCSSFTEILEGAPGMPRSLLSERLRQLESMGVVRRSGTGRATSYSLTKAGKDLGHVCAALGEWGLRWLEISHQHLDPYFMLWSISKEVALTTLPERRLTIRFEFSNVRANERRFWLVLHQPEAEICANHPGFEEDLVVKTDPRSLAGWRLGEYGLATAMRSGRITVEGPREAIKRFERLTQPTLVG